MTLKKKKIEFIDVKFCFRDAKETSIHLTYYFFSFLEIHVSIPLICPVFVSDLSKRLDFFEETIFLFQRRCGKG